jgi:L-glyceraldehyde 3-phosphate reductase
MTSTNAARVGRLREVAAGLGVPMSNLALAWSLARPEITSTIVGASRPEQIVENVRSSEVHLPDTILDRISAILGG